MPLPIEDYAVVGDTQTAALIGRDGSVDWLCLPRFDSPACFAALLGTSDHGRWLIGPADEAECSRRYVGDSAVLESTYKTATGTFRVTDVMPVADQRADLIRRVEGLEGTARVRHEWVVRLGYGAIRPWVTRDEHGGEAIITAVAGPDRITLRGSRLPRAHDGRHEDEFEISAGEVMAFSTTWRPSHLPFPKFLDLEARIATTTQAFQDWADRCHYTGPHRDAVVRSVLTLRLLTHGTTGGIVAAPTTSLPEEFGGERNWDYRFCWLRDASLALESLLRCGYRREVELWRSWLLRAVAGDPQDLQIMYTVDGGRDLPERVLGHLPGYAGSRPVRIGNAAVDQRQTDVLGEVMAALHLARQKGVHDDASTWALQRALVDELADHWDEPDNGLWEIRGNPRHFTHSRVMVWVAFDRAIRACEEHGLDGPVERWRQLREQVRAEVLERGVDPVRGCFTQHYDTTEVDASLLVLPTMGFIAGDDPLMLGTIAAIENDLMRDGLLLRYRTETGVDGLIGDENPFLACSFWLVSAYAAAGRVEDAERLFDRLIGLRNDVGLLAEEHDPRTGRHAGNFPQAFSHLTLVNAALDLAEAERRPAGLSPTQQ
ncbi:MAG: Glucoamylase [uncultured Nocardioidaceae bacterium]|uniref:Trehalase n=1 Tax=uncultured Nocardioidaceae bacterium TaxID=253824 RepID=A0A6J4NN85_9ACTN|nr:MAG: Glucoamylase [uncultured Nocardioidaceae bacterium]